MAELRRHDRPDEPHPPEPDQPHRPEQDDAHRRVGDRRVTPGIQQLFDLQNPPDKPERPVDPRTPAKIQELLDLQAGPKHRAVIFSAPDKQTHSPEKPAQQDPDIAAPYGPMSEIANGPDAPESNRANRFSRFIDQSSQRADDLADRIQRAGDRVTQLIDPKRPPNQDTTTSTRMDSQPVYRETPKDVPQDVLAHLTVTAVFLLRVGQQIWNHQHKNVEQQRTTNE